MRAITGVVKAFDALTSKEKARWIAALCAVLGVLTGAVLYIVFTHSFERGQLWTKVVGLGLGLVVAIVLARLAEWLWHTINTGRADIGRHFSQTASTAILLVVVFELCVSAFEDFTKAAIGDYDAIQRIAAQVAGQSDDPALTNDNTAFPALYGAMSAVAMNEPDPSRGPTSARDVLRRLIGFFEPKERALLYRGDVPQEEMDRLFAVLPFEGIATDMLSMSLGTTAPTWLTTCKLALPHRTTTLETGLRAFDPESPERQAWEATCRQAIGAVSLSDRIAALPRAINLAMARHDLYDTVMFARQGVDGRLLLPSDELVARQAWDQRTRCDKIRGNESFPGAAPNPFNCVMFLASTPERTKAGPNLLQTAKMQEINRELLARVLPEYIEPRAINWGDLALLLLVWSVAAVVLGVFLSDTVFGVPDRASMPDVLKLSWASAGMAIFFAVLSLAVAVIVLRLVVFFWDLMFAAPPLEPHLFEDGIIWSVVSFFPNVIAWLKAGGLFGLAIPGWITVPLIFGTVLITAAAAKDDHPLRVISLYVLFGILILSVGPIFQGLLGLMVLVAVTWIVPAFGLATILPYLEPGAALPRWWGFIALSVAVLLGLWSLLAIEDDALVNGVLLVSSIAFAVLGVLILRQRPLRDVWPLVAVTVMMSLIGAASIVQQATFQGALNQLHPLTASDQSAKEPSGPLDYLYFGLIRPGEQGPQVPEEAVLEASDDAVRQAGHLELALVGSLGFWLTIALLAAWSLRRGALTQDHQPAVAAANGEHQTS
jgi:hypothetical protein